MAIAPVSRPRESFSDPIDTFVDISSLHLLADQYRGGKISSFPQYWKSLTSDKFIIDIVLHGLRLNFACIPEGNHAHEYGRNKTDIDSISREISALLAKRVISISSHEEGEYFSNLFTVPKPDGTLRTILNLKKLNITCDTSHFKMESISNVIKMVQRDSYMASVDLKDAFYSIPIHPDHQKFLKFSWFGTIYKFICMPNGYNDAMRVFTKVLKPAFASLREEGHMSVIYVDDTFLIGDSFSECIKNVVATIRVLQSLGFTIHIKKSVLTPSKMITFLGYNIDSHNMTISITPKKKDKIFNLASRILSEVSFSIRLLSSFIGNIVAALVAVPFGKLHYRALERFKIFALSCNRGNFDAVISLSCQEARKETLWWKDNILNSSQSLLEAPDIDATIFSDASQLGWGASNGIGHIGGRWSVQEQLLHINALELMAIKFALFSFLCHSHKHIRIMSDNTTAICYLNKMGGVKSMACDRIAKEIWNFCISHSVWVSAAHIPGIENVVADFRSRIFNDATEWMIPDRVFDSLCIVWGYPDIDLFASRLNSKLPVYSSWEPDPGATAIDAFSFPWSGLYVYAFPPFSLIWSTLRRIRTESMKALVIIPMWTTQSWFPAALRMTISHPVIIPSSCLSLPGTLRKHPLAPKMQLLALQVSGDLSMHFLFLKGLRTSSYHHGGHSLGPNIMEQSENGRSFVVRGTRVRCIHLCQIS